MPPILRVPPHKYCCILPLVEAVSNTKGSAGHTQVSCLFAEFNTLQVQVQDRLSFRNNLEQDEQDGWRHEQHVHFDGDGRAEGHQGRAPPALRQQPYGGVGHLLKRAPDLHLPSESSNCLPENVAGRRYVLAPGIARLYGMCCTTYRSEICITQCKQILAHKSSSRGCMIESILA